MSSDFLDDEDRFAEDDDQNELLDDHALRQPVNRLPELQPVVSVGPETTVREAIQQMVSRRVGCLLITEDDSLKGVFR